ncbi:MAG: hypothetical protein GW890_09755, partial [Vibrio sp.]|nr:hypothetical protein [Vibrio sp.]
FEYLECRRAPEFDKFSESGKVPTQALLDAGWWFECNHCGKKVIDEDHDDYVVDGEVVFCNASCKTSHEKDIADRNHKFELFKDKVKSMRPDLEFTEFKGGYPWITNVAKFTFQGAKYGGSAIDQEGVGHTTWRISNGDLEVWDQYESTTKREQLKISGKVEGDDLDRCLVKLGK